MTAAPILVFDSGIGGLSVLRELRTVMPDRRFVYVADDAAFPYGDWEEEALIAHVGGCFAALIAEHRPAAALIACNTASTLVLDALRARFDIPFIGTVPAIKPAAERTWSGRISVLATPGTVRREYTHNLIERHAGGRRVSLVGSKRLAGLAEAYIRGAPIDTAAVRAEIAPCFIETEGRTDIVVLACTHYPFLGNIFRKLAPWPVDWLDPAEAIARQVLHVTGLQGEGPLPESFDRAIFTAGPPDHTSRRLLHGFGLSV